MVVVEFKKIGTFFSGLINPEDWSSDRFMSSTEYNNVLNASNVINITPYINDIQEKANKLFVDAWNKLSAEYNFRVYFNDCYGEPVYIHQIEFDDEAFTAFLLIKG